MTDVDLLAKKLALIETSIQELRKFGQPENLKKDIREQRFIEHTLRVAIQAALDAASHIVSDQRLGEPKANREMFEILERFGWLSPAFTKPLMDMAGFRNILVHGYDAVDLDIVKDVVENRLQDLLSFVKEIREKIPSDPGENET